MMPKIQSAQKKDIVQWNEEMARKYDPEAYHLHSNFLIRWIERRRVRAILRFLNANQHKKVLEIGCGAGNVLEQIPVQCLFGIDLSTFLLQKSQKRLAPCEANLAQADAAHLPFTDQQFDRMVCTEVLEHVEDPRVLIREIARMATLDAVIVISVPNEKWIEWVKYIICGLGLKRWLLQGGAGSYSSPDQMIDEWHLHRFDLAFLRKELKDILYIQQVQAIPFQWIPLRYVVCCRLVKGEK